MLLRFASNHINGFCTLFLELQAVHRLIVNVYVCVCVCVCVFIGLCAFASEWMRFCVHNDRKILYSQEDSGLLNRLEYCSINWSHLHDPRLNFHALYWKLCVLDFKQHTKSLSLGIFLCGCCFVISLAFSCSHVIFIICLHIVVKCDTCKYKHF